MAPRKKKRPDSKKAIAIIIITGCISTCLILTSAIPGLSAEARAQEISPTRSLRVLTSFSPDFYLPFIDAYKKDNPDLQLQILNKKTTAALTEIQRGNTREFDIFWSSSPDAFAVLKENDKLARTHYRPKYPPLSKEQLFIGDADGYFFNFAISGIGYMWNESLLKDLNIAAPSNWSDLAEPRFYGQLAMSTPSRSGTNHLIVESLLQGMGWVDGWRYILKMSGNLETITARSFSVPEGVAKGRFGAGMVIDFLAISKMSLHDEIKFSYGRPVFLMPAGIAVLKDSKKIEEAVSFIDFILSAEGQQILLNPSIGRLPVSGAVVSPNEPERHPLLELIHSGLTASYNTELSRSRYRLVNALFDQLITYRLLERRRIWKMLLKLEREYGQDSVAEIGIRESVLNLLCEIPISEEQSVDKELNNLFNITLSSGYGEKKREMLHHWDVFISERFEQAKRLLKDADQLLAAKSLNS